MLIIKNSKRLYAKGLADLVGGVNSPVRSFKGVETDILYAQRAKGPNIWDVDGNQYIDYIMSWGVSILGHAYKPVTDAAIKAIKNGSSFGLATEQEIKLAALIKKHMPSINKVRLVSSGTEACMTAVRVARAFSGKTKIIKFDGCYHGHFDSLLVKSGSGNLTFGIPSGLGILPAYSQDTISLPYNNIELFKEAVEKNRPEIACCIIEPVPCNTGVIIPEDGYLKALAQICKQEKIILIFDEVITGFRLGLSGAQGLFGITPDLTCLGKIIGGGFPMSALGGRRDIMDLLSPAGPVYQAGTLSGNPVAVAAGIKTLESLAATKTFYSSLEKKTKRLMTAIKKEAKANGVDLTINSIGSLFSLFFTDKNISCHADTQFADKTQYAHFFAGLLHEGVLLPPSAFEACFVSSAHSETVIGKTAQAVKKIFKAGRPTS